jgi:hypothetical protein
VSRGRWVPQTCPNPKEEKKKKKHKKEDCGNNQERIITKNSILN